MRNMVGLVVAGCLIFTEYVCGHPATGSCDNGWLL